jgi:thiamine pyrophosphate-dependent acetolactate synthase large subunit-like protein
MISGHGGQLALAALRAAGVKEIFTLSGGHVFPLYDAAHTEGVPIYDVRHEQSAVFAAEAVAKLQRRPGVAVLTAGPGVTNGVSGVTSAFFNAAPVLVLGGRAPQFRWGSGSLQEIDHIPIMRSITKHAVTVMSTESIPTAVSEALSASLSGHRGPSFVDFPLEVMFGFGEASVELPKIGSWQPDPDAVKTAAGLVARAERPMLIAGSDVYGAGAEAELQAFAEAFGVPVYANGMGRGIVGPPLGFAKTRGMALKQADLVMVIGTPLDFRLGFGEFGAATLIHVVAEPARRATHVSPAVSPAGDLRLVLAGMNRFSGDRASHADWLEQLRAAENAATAKHAEEMAADTDPIKPARVYGELRKVLEKDAVTIGDGGDFVSYAGRYLEPSEPGTWLDPGPYGCLGTGMGYAMGARVTYPDRQICVLMGDGAAGFSLMDVESLVRQKLPVVIVVGNNGIWGLEKHPMRTMYGYDVAADLQPGLRYDEVVRALGGAGETVARASELGAAFRRAFASGVPYLVNVLTDPADAYPRSANLA